MGVVFDFDFDVFYIAVEPLVRDFVHGIWKSSRTSKDFKKEWFEDLIIGFQRARSGNAGRKMPSTRLLIEPGVPSISMILFTICSRDVNIGQLCC